jgi:hypothetical protein
MKFSLPRRHRKSFEVITKKKLDDNINKSEAIQICADIKKEFDNSPQTFGSLDGKKDSLLELLIILSNQISEEYKDCEVSFKQGVPEIIKIKQ